MADNNNKQHFTGIMPVIISFFGSIIVAVIIGQYTLKAGIDSVALQNKANLEAVEINVKGQIDSVKLTNETQLKSILLSNENNLKIIVASHNNNISSIKFDNELKQKGYRNKEARKRKAEVIEVVNFFLSDIKVRVQIFEAQIKVTKNLIKEGVLSFPDLSIDNQFMLSNFLDSIIHSAIMKHANFAYLPIEKDFIIQHLPKLPISVSTAVLTFYRSLEILGNANESIKEQYKYIEEFSESILKLYRKHTNSESTKKGVIMLREIVSESTLIMLSISNAPIISGFKALKELNKYLGKIDNIKIIDKKLKDINADNKNDVSNQFNPNNLIIKMKDFVKHIESQKLSTLDKNPP